MDLDYTEYLLGQGLTAKTVKDYQREVDLALAWFQHRGLELSQAVPSQLREYAGTRPNTPSIRAHLRSALTYWWEWQEIRGWPKAIEVPTPAPMICQAFSVEDTRRLNRAALDWWREGTAVLVGIHLGLRNAEICAMRWEGFDPNMEWYRFVGKGNRQRVVAVSPLLASQLVDYRRRSGLVFEGRWGDPLSHGTLRLWLRKVVDEAGLEGEVWVHRLRHTFGATANDETGDLRAVQEAMGHARPETTAGYTRATAARLRMVSNAVAEAVR